MEEAVRRDRVFVMHEGHVVMEGTPKKIFSQVEKLKSYHLDVPQVTELAYELKKEGIMLPSDILTVDEMVNTLCQLN